MKRLLVSLLLVLVYAAPAYSVEPFIINDIRVEGLQRISPGTVFNYLPVSVGDVLNDQNSAAALRTLFDTGFFSDVVLAQQGDILVIQVEERPAIARINIEGNKDIKTEDLLRALNDFGMSEGELFRRVTLERMEQSLQREYNNRGKYNVDLKTEVETLPRNRVGIDITIEEGDAARIRHINIVGNEAFSDEELTKAFEADTSNWLSWYSRDDQYSEEKLQGDLEALQSYYQDRGYIDFEIESTQVTISPDKKDIYITANIREGEVYTVSEISMTGEFVLAEESLRQLVVIEEGTTFSRRLLEASVNNITATLANVGYAFANVNPEPELDKENREVKINLFIDPRKRVYVRRITFAGNDKTKDEVLRREMRQFEGGWFSQVALDRSRLRLQRLSYLEDVNIETPPVPGTDDQVDINISVKERTAGSFAFGLGFGQTSGLITSLSFSQENFLGSGKQFGLSVNDSRFFKRLDISYVDPYWSEDGVSRGYNLSVRTLDQGDANLAFFSSDTIAFGVSFGLPVTEVDRVRLLLGAEDTDIAPDPRSPDVLLDELVFYGLAATCSFDRDSPDFDPRCFSNGLKSADSSQTLRAEFLWSHDSRNRFFTPTRGSVQRLSAEIALPGSTVEHYKLFYTATKYFPITRNLAFSIGGELGYGDTYGDDSDSPFGLPFYEHFYGGGVRSVRGFKDNTLGPRPVLSTTVDPDTGETIENLGLPIGGDLKVTGSANLYFPIPFVGQSNNTRLSWFMDFGQIYTDIDNFDADRLRYSTGISLQWQAPVGPIIINYAIPFNDDDNDDVEQLQFAFGNFF